MAGGFDIQDGNAALDAPNSKALIDACGLQLEALMDAANFAIRQTYMIYAEGVYLSEHGAWVDLKMKVGENEDVYRNKVYARLRMERNTLNSIRNVVSTYTDDFSVKELQQPSGSFILGASLLGSSARLFNYDQTIKGILIEVPADMPIKDVRALFEDVKTVREAGTRVMVYQEGKGIVIATANVGLIGTIANGSGGVVTDGQINDPDKEYALYPNAVDSSGIIVGSPLNKATTLFGVATDVTDIIPAS